MFDWSGLLAFLIACLLAWVVKFAFLDSFILCQTMAGYMDVAQNTPITLDLYEKLCGLSGKFRELFNKRKEENPEMPSAVAEAAPESSQVPVYAQPEAAPQPAAQDGIMFCGQCGAKNARSGAFCTACGAKLHE